MSQVKWRNLKVFDRSAYDLLYFTLQHLLDLQGTWLFICRLISKLQNKEANKKYADMNRKDEWNICKATIWANKRSICKGSSSMKMKDDIDKKHSILVEQKN